MKTIRFLTMFAAVAFVFGAFADYVVYWQVNDAYDIYAQKAVEFEYATISGLSSADDTPTLLRQYDNNGTVTTLTRIYSDPDDSDSFATSTFSGPLGSPDDFSYYSIGLYGVYGGSDVLLAWQKYSKADVLSHIFETSTIEKGGGSPLTVSNVVPEPTSALLMLVGLAGLALKRRRA